MKKKLVKLENIDEYIVGNKFYKNKDMILTPLINDYLLKEKITIIYDNEKRTLTKVESCEELIKKILKESCNTVGLEQINEIIKRIKEI